MMYVQIFRIKSHSTARRATGWIDDYWPIMKNSGAAMIVEVYQQGHPRTERQNNRYWNVVLRQIEEKAWDENGRQHHRGWWHEHFALMFNPIDNDEGQVVGGPTSKLDITAFNRYMHEIERHAMEVLGVEFDGDLVPLDFSALGNAP